MKVQYDNGSINGIWSWGALILVVVACIPLGLQIALPDGIKVDEGAHFGQIQAFWAGRVGSPQEFGLTMLPGYHVLVAVLAKLIGLESLFGARMVGLLFSIPSVLIFALISKRVGDNNPAQSALVYFLCPLFFPYFFLLYTDITSVTFVSLAVLFTLNKRFFAAAFVLLLSMLVRQDNVIWALLCFVLALHQFLDLNQSDGLSDKALVALNAVTKHLWAFPVLFVGFGVFFVLNGGVAIGDSESHKVERIHLTQVFLCVLVLFVLMLPLHVANLKKIVALIYHQPFWLFIGASAFPLYIATFWTEHGYNNFGGFIHNEVVIWLKASLAHKVYAYLGIVWCFYSLVVTPLAEKRFFWLYPLSALAVVPHSLVEPRYFIVPIVLFLALRKRNGDDLEYVILSIYVIATWYLCTEIRAGAIFL
ncbi:MAG: hypothetical protein U1F46_02020 [Marinagarivorans sp.]